MALLTHVDQVCVETARDVTRVYNSRTVRDAVSSDGPLGLSTFVWILTRRRLLWLCVDQQSRRSAGYVHVLHRPGEELLVRAGSGREHRRASAQCCGPHPAVR